MPADEVSGARENADRVGGRRPGRCRQLPGRGVPGSGGLRLGPARGLLARGRDRGGRQPLAAHAPRLRPRGSGRCPERDRRLRAALRPLPRQCPPSCQRALPLGEEPRRRRRSSRSPCSRLRSSWAGRAGRRSRASAGLAPGPRWAPRLSPPASRWRSRRQPGPRATPSGTGPARTSWSSSWTRCGRIAFPPARHTPPPRRLSRLAARGRVFTLGLGRVLVDGPLGRPDPVRQRAGRDADARRAPRRARLPDGGLHRQRAPRARGRGDAGLRSGGAERGGVAVGRPRDRAWRSAGAAAPRERRAAGDEGDRVDRAPAGALLPLRPPHGLPHPLSLPAPRRAAKPRATDRVPPGGHAADGRGGGLDPGTLRRRGPQRRRPGRTVDRRRRGEAKALRGARHLRPRREPRGGGPLVPRRQPRTGVSWRSPWSSWATASNGGWSPLRWDTPISRRRSSRRPRSPATIAVGPTFGGRCQPESWKAPCPRAWPTAPTAATSSSSTSRRGGGPSTTGSPTRRTSRPRGLGGRSRRRSPPGSPSRIGARTLARRSRSACARSATSASSPDARAKPSGCRAGRQSGPARPRRARRRLTVALRQRAPSHHAGHRPHLAGHGAGGASLGRVEGAAGVAATSAPWPLLGFWALAVFQIVPLPRSPPMVGSRLRGCLVPRRAGRSRRPRSRSSPRLGAPRGHFPVDRLRDRGRRPGARGGTRPA